jgi:hypothetical protein
MAKKARQRISYGSSMPSMSQSPYCQTPHVAGAYHLEVFPNQYVRYEVANAAVVYLQCSSSPTPRLEATGWVSMV